MNEIMLKRPAESKVQSLVFILEEGTLLQRLYSEEFNKKENNEQQWLY